MKQLRLIIASFLMGAVLLPMHGSAQTPTPSPGPIAPKPCDSTYFDSLESRAWLEAQREITQNQNLIFKPDSVLSYTCFNQYARVLANMQAYGGGQGLFSESKRWGEVIPSREDLMDNALKGLVGAPLTKYYANFKHTYLGGRASSGPYKEDDVSGGLYTCSEMDKVWKLAKCYDFQEKKDQDGFFTFEEHQTQDKRILPTACDTEKLRSVWETQRRQAGLIPASGASWPFDKMEVYFKRFEPDQCGQVDPLPTGVVVEPSDGKPVAKYNEKVCIQPGCYYYPTSETDGQCTSSIDPAGNSSGP